MAILALLSSLTNYPKWRCQIAGDTFTMMNVLSNQPIKNNSYFPLINGLEKHCFRWEMGSFVSSLFLFFKQAPRSLGTDYMFQCPKIQMDSAL